MLWRCWLGGRKGIRPVNTEWWGAGMVICLERGADLHTAQLMPLPLTALASVKSRFVFPFWYWLTWVVPEKGPLNGCVCAVWQCFDIVGWVSGRACSLYNWLTGCRCGYLSGARCRLFSYGPSDATVSQNPIICRARLVLPFWYWLRVVL